MTTLANAKRVILVPPGTWAVDPTRSTVGFEVRHLKLMHVRGYFHAVTAVISCDDEGAASIAASIRVASIDSGDQRRDARLCAQDFFDAAHHPAISFAGESQPVPTGDALTVRGTMSMRSVSRPIELRAEPGGAHRGNGHVALRVRAEGALSRRDFGLDWDSAFAAGPPGVASYLPARTAAAAREHDIRLTRRFVTFSEPPAVPRTLKCSCRHGW